MRRLMAAAASVVVLILVVLGLACGKTLSTMVVDKVVSSIVFPLDGNVYPMGFYNVTLNIGQPAKPYFLDVDTGSDLTWLQCDAPCVQCIKAPHDPYRPHNNIVPCEDPICKAVHSHGEHKCKDPEQCDYELKYADGLSTLGLLVNDVFLLNFTDRMRTDPRLTFGCGYDQMPAPGGAIHPLDGMLGLGRGKATILAQLSGQDLVKNIIGHCFSGRGGGFLFFGDDVYNPSHVTWTPMSRNYKESYSPGNAQLIFDGKTTGLKDLLVLFDSGSSYSYFNSRAYQVLITLVKSGLTRKPLEETADDQTLPICWKGRKPFKSVRDVRKYFKPLALSFTESGKANARFEISPEGYLIISSKGNACLAILNGTEIGLHNLNIVGDISMQDRMIIYDNEKQAIGWIPAKCNKIPKSRRSII